MASGSIVPSATILCEIIVGAVTMSCTAACGPGSPELSEDPNEIERHHFKRRSSLLICSSSGLVDEWPDTLPQLSVGVDV